MRTADCTDARAATGLQTALAAVETAFDGLWRRHYSLKANDLPAGTSFLLGRGWAASVVPTGEWQHARSGGAARYGGHHRVRAIATRSGPDAAAFPTLLEGPLGESTDSPGTHELPPLRRDDVVAIQDAGACAASFTSRFNGRPQPAEVLLWPGGSLQRCDRPPLELRREASPDEVFC